MPRQLSVTLTAVLRLALATAVVTSCVVVVGGTAVWHLEGDRPGTTFRSLGDGIWWALTTVTTVGYGDQVPETTSGRIVAAMIMIMGVAVLGAVAAVVALIFATAVARREESILEAREGRWKRASRPGWTGLTSVWRELRNTSNATLLVTTLAGDDAWRRGDVPASMFL